MNPWLETAGVVQIALLGIILGRVFQGFKKTYWAGGYFLSLLLIAILVLARYNCAVHFVPPFCWIAVGRTRFVVLSFAITMGLTTPLSRLPCKWEKVAICILMGVSVTWFSVLPFLVPALIKNNLFNLKTRLDSNDICKQSTNYTCGPATAVTALRKLGLPANEGEIAVLSHSSPVTGTLVLCLCKALENRYAADGLKCQYRHFDSIAQLKDAGITLAVVKNAFLLDHCVAVLEVSDQTITVADPVAGRKSMSHKQFEKIWRFSGIVLKRDCALTGRDTTTEDI